MAKYCYTINKNGVNLYWKIDSKGNLNRIRKQDAKGTVTKCKNLNTRKKEAAKKTQKPFFKHQTEKYCKSKDKNGKILYWKIDKDGKRRRTKKNDLPNIKNIPLCKLTKKKTSLPTKKKPKLGEKRFFVRKGVKREYQWSRSKSGKLGWHVVKRKSKTKSSPKPKPVPKIKNKTLSFKLTVTKIKVGPGAKIDINTENVNYPEKTSIATYIRAAKYILSKLENTDINLYVDKNLRINNVITHDLTTIYIYLKTKIDVNFSLIDKDYLEDLYNEIILQFLWLVTEEMKKRFNHPSKSSLPLDCKKIMCDKGIYSKKDYWKWVLNNHPDKAVTEEERKRKEKIFKQLNPILKNCVELAQYCK